MPYIFALTYADLESLKHRREAQAWELFKKILSPTSSLYTAFCPNAWWCRFGKNPEPSQIRSSLWKNQKISVIYQFWVLKLSIKHSFIFLQDCIACFHCHMLFYVISYYLHCDVYCCSVFWPPSCNKPQFNLSSESSRLRLHFRNILLSSAL